MTVTLSDLIAQVKQRADMTNGGFNEEGIPNFINQAYLRLYDLLISTYQDYKVTHFDFTVVSPNDGYDIPTSVSIYKLRGIDFNPNTTTPITVGSFQWAERNKYNGVAALAIIPWYDTAPVVYCYLGDRIVFRPSTQANGNYRCWYIPDLTLLVDDTDEVDINMERWSPYIIAVAAAKLLDSEESDTSALQQEISILETQIRGLASNRDANAGHRVANTRELSDGAFGSTFTRFP